MPPLAHRISKNSWGRLLFLKLKEGSYKLSPAFNPNRVIMSALYILRDQYRIYLSFSSKSVPTTHPGSENQRQPWSSGLLGPRVRELEWQWGGVPGLLPWCKEGGNIPLWGSLGKGPRPKAAPRFFPWKPVATAASTPLAVSRVAQTQGANKFKSGKQSQQALFCQNS